MRSRRWFSNSGGTFSRRTLGIDIPTVEAASDTFPNARSLRFVGRIDESFGKARQFWSGQFTFGVKLVRKTDYASLRVAVELLDLFDNLLRRHSITISRFIGLAQ